MKTSKKNYINTLITYVLVFYFGASLISMFLTKILSINNINYMYDGGLNITAWINFLTYIALIIPLAIINRKELKESFTEMTKTKGYVKAIVISCLLAYASNYLISIYAADITYRFNDAYRIFGKEFIHSESNNQNTIVAILHSDGALITILSAAIIGPIVEELVFRKALFGIIKDKELALFVSASIFSMIHVISSIGNYNMFSILLMFFTYFLPGLAFGYIYYKHDNIWYPAIAHMIMNTISMIAILLL